jgi:endonuclease YncB( thermonuclease family)
MILLALSLCIASVHDGDTIRSCQSERIRLVGIDAPEVKGSPRCSAKQRKRLAGSKNPPWCDFAKGDQARRKLSAFLSWGGVVIYRQGKDRYGRTLARVSVGGQDAGQFLIGLGLARSWN